MKNFFKAVENNKVSKVQKLLGEIQNINAWNDKGENALFIAAKEDYDKLLKVLVDAGADLNHKVNGETPLIKACLRGATKSAQVLIEAGADLNEKDNDGLSAVFLCFSLNQDEIAKLLIEAGADINCKNNNGDTPLHAACFKGNVELVKTLLEAGALLNTQNKNGYSPLHIACEKMNEQLVKALVSKDAKLNIKDNEGNTPLHIACYSGSLDIVKILFINSQLDMNVRNNYQETPVHLAILAEKLEIIKYLSSTQADFTALNGLKENAFHYAFKTGNNDIIRFIKDNGKTDINSPDMFGDTPLISYIKEGYVGQIVNLIEIGANPHIINKFNESAIDVYSRNWAFIRSNTFGYKFIKTHSQKFYDADIAFYTSDKDKLLDSVDILMGNELAYMVNFKQKERQNSLIENLTYKNKQMLFIEDLYQNIKEDLKQNPQFEQAFFEINFLITGFKRVLSDIDSNNENLELFVDGSQKIVFINHDIQRKILPLFESLLNDEQLAEKVKPYQAQIDTLKNINFSY